MANDCISLQVEPRLHGLELDSFPLPNFWRIGFQLCFLYFFSETEKITSSFQVPQCQCTGIVDNTRVNPQTSNIKVLRPKQSLPNAKPRLKWKINNWNNIFEPPTWLILIKGPLTVSADMRKAANLQNLFCGQFCIKPGNGIIRCNLKDLFSAFYIIKRRHKVTKNDMKWFQNRIFG